MKKLILAMLVLCMVASETLAAGLSGGVVVLPRATSVLVDGDPAIWYAETGYVNGQWRDRSLDVASPWAGIAGLIPQTFMAQSTYGDLTRTTISGLSAGRGYDVWILYSIGYSATTGLRLKDNSILAALDGSALVRYNQDNSTDTGLVSRNEATTIWRVFEGHLGTFVADGSGQIKVIFDFPDGTPVVDRTVFHGFAYTSLDISYNSPQTNATNVPLALSDPANDLVFTVEDGATLTAVDVYLGTLPDPNLTDPNMASSWKIVDRMAVAPGQFTVDLVGEVAADLAYDTTYYWKIVGYDGLEVRYIGPVSNFRTLPLDPVISIAPARLGVFSGETGTITATAASYDSLQWYKEGVGELSNDAKYSGVSTLTLQVSSFQESDAGNYYCVATKASTGVSVASNLAYAYQKKTVAHWDFESTYVADGNSFAPDIVGGRDAKLMYGATVVTGTGPDSVTGGYLSLSNPTYVDSRVNPTLGQWALINSDANLVNHKTLTISAWFRPAASQSTDSRIFEFGRNTNNWIAMLTTNSSEQPGFTIDANSILTSLRSTKSITFGGWHHLVATVDSTLVTNQAKLYLDGNLVREGTWAGAIQLMLPSTYCIGRTSLGSNIGFYNGLIDELKVYNYILSLTDIRRDYLLGAPYICDAAAYPSIQAFDFDGNCQISFGDFAILAQNWLNHARITSIP
jgi:hypothetical protein